MTPHFAAAVDPVFLYVLDVLDRISDNRAPQPDEVRQSLQNQFREAEAKLGQKPGWELAKYALVAWIDDVLIGAPWEGRDWWENNSLEFEYFKTRDRAIEFFKQAKDAADLTRRDALEVFYVCVVLGFRGLYKLPDAAFLGDQLDLPANVEAWSQRTARAIQLGQGRPPIRQTPRPGSGAPPLEGKFLFVGVSLMAVVLGAITVICGYFWLLPALFP